jgi:hypothetical protein
VNCSHRHGVKDRIYPAVSPAKGDKVCGKVGVFLNPGPAVVTLTTLPSLCSISASCNHPIAANHEITTAIVYSPSG